MSAVSSQFTLPTTSEANHSDYHNSQVQKIKCLTNNIWSQYAKPHPILLPTRQCICR